MNEKAIRSALIYEIRYRKFTVRNLKEDNPLFKQVNLSIPELKENLTLLLTKTNRSMASTVTMADLENVIGNNGLNKTSRNNQQEQPMQETIIEDSNWQLKIGEHVAVSFDDGFYIGEVKKLLDQDTAEISYMEPKKVLTASADEDPRKFWIWPFPEVKYDTSRESIMDMRPAELTLARPPSTSRMLVFSVGNAELLGRLWSDTKNL